MPGWRNGRRGGLKPPFSYKGVWVRVPSRAPTPPPGIFAQALGDRYPVGDHNDFIVGLERELRRFGRVGDNVAG